MSENINLLTIPHLRELFSCEVGLSDHTMGVAVSVASVTTSSAMTAATAWRPNGMRA